MTDVYLLAVVIVFFVAAARFVRWCDGVAGGNVAEPLPDAGAGSSSEEAVPS